MRVLVLSDIHANRVALTTLESTAREADLVLCAGDFIGYYCEVNEVLDTVRGWNNAIHVRGNHDTFLLEGCPAALPDAVRFGIEFADRVIDESHRRWLASLPLIWGGTAGGRSILLCHGSPYRPLTDYLYQDRISAAGLDAFDFDLIAFGQTHRSLIRVGERPILLNPGSVGQSRDKRAVACAALVETDAFDVELIEHAYDPTQVIQLALQHGAGDWISKHLCDD